VQGYAIRAFDKIVFEPSNMKVYNVSLAYMPYMAYRYKY